MARTNGVMKSAENPRAAPNGVPHIYRAGRRGCGQVRPRWAQLQPIIASDAMMRGRGLIGSRTVARSIPKMTQDARVS